MAECLQTTDSLGIIDMILQKTGLILQPTTTDLINLQTTDQQVMEDSIQCQTEDLIQRPMADISRLLIPDLILNMKF